jgi:hypothetical protein
MSFCYLDSLTSRRVTLGLGSFLYAMAAHNNKRLDADRKVKTLSKYRTKLAEHFVDENQHLLQWSLGQLDDLAHATARSPCREIKSSGCIATRSPVRSAAHTCLS